jgi:hypothetical protein
MNKREEYMPCLIELDKLLTRANRFYNDRELSDRYRTPPNWEAKKYDENEVFNDFIRQQTVGTAFRAKWLNDITNIASRIKRTDKADYEKIRKIFNDISFKENGWADTEANYLEAEINNLQKVIDWLSSEYNIEIAKGFNFNIKTNKLYYGSELKADYSKGKRLNSNPNVLLKALFKNTHKTLNQEEIDIDTSTDMRAIEQGARAINKAINADLVQWKLHPTMKSYKFWLNKDLLAKT